MNEPQRLLAHKLRSSKSSVARQIAFAQAAVQMANDAVEAAREKASLAVSQYDDADSALEKAEKAYQQAKVVLENARKDENVKLTQASYTREGGRPASAAEITAIINAAQKRLKTFEDKVEQAGMAYQQARKAYEAASAAKQKAQAAYLTIKSQAGSGKMQAAEGAVHFAVTDQQGHPLKVGDKVKTSRGVTGIITEIIGSRVYVQSADSFDTHKTGEATWVEPADRLIKMQAEATEHAAQFAAKAPGIDKLKANIAQLQREAESYKQKDPSRYEFLMNDVQGLTQVLQAAQRGDRNAVQSIASRLETAVRDEIPLDLWRWSQVMKDKPLGRPAPGYQQAAKMLAALEQDLKQAQAENDQNYIRHLNQDILPGFRIVVAAAAKGDYLKLIEATQNEYVRQQVPSELNKWIQEQKRLRFSSSDAVNNGVSMALDEHDAEYVKATRKYNDDLRAAINYAQQVERVASKITARLKADDLEGAAVYINQLKNMQTAHQDYVQKLMATAKSR